MQPAVWSFRNRYATVWLTSARTIEIREREGVIEIEPAPTAMCLEERNGHVVAVPDCELPPLTDELVRATLNKSRR